MKLILGTAQIGLDYGINNKLGKIPKEEAFQILEYALNNNISILDTAYLYGDSENIIGEFIKKTGKSFDIISKFPSYSNEENIEDILNDSLSRLNVPKLYAYLVHDFKSFISGNPQGLWNKLNILKKENKIEKLGFSLYYPEEIDVLFKRDIEFDVVQIPYNIFDQRFISKFKILKKKNIEIHVRSIFLQGLVFKKLEELDKNFEKLKDKIKFIRNKANELNISIESICLNFINLNEAVDKIVIGIDSLENLKSNLSALKDIDKVKSIYGELLNLKEEDENIILPFNWEK